MEKHPIEIHLGDVVEYSAFERNPNKKVMRRGEVVAIVPEGFPPNRQWLNSKLQKTHYTYNFKLGVAYPHPTYIIKAAIGKKSFFYDRPRVHNITGVVKSQPLQQSLFSKVEETVRKQTEGFIGTATPDIQPRQPQSPMQPFIDSLPGHTVIFICIPDGSGLVLVDGVSCHCHIHGGVNDSGIRHTAIAFS